MIKVTIKRLQEFNHGNLDRARDKRLIKDILLLILTTGGTLPNSVAQNWSMSIMILVITKRQPESNHGKPDKARETKRVKATSKLMLTTSGMNPSMVVLT